LCEVAVALTETFPGELARYARVTVETCAFACSGDVLKIQQMLEICGEHPEKTEEEETKEEKKDEKKDEKEKKEEKKDEKKDLKKEEKKEEDNTKVVNPQGVAVLGLALISMAEDVGSKMAIRIMEPLLRYGEPSVRRAVPLTMGLLNVSNPNIIAIDLLSKLSHDHDQVSFFFIVIFSILFFRTLLYLQLLLLEFAVLEQTILELVESSKTLLNFIKGSIALFTV